MQKIVVGVLLAALSAFGLVAIGSNEARAAVDCPYSGCVFTDTRINGPAIAESGKVRFRVRVVSLSGTAKPKGSIRVKCEGPGRDKVKRRDYNREPRRVTFRLRARGVWECQAKFRSDFKFKRSKDTTSVVIRRRR